MDGIRTVEGRGCRGAACVPFGICCVGASLYGPGVMTILPDPPADRPEAVWFQPYVEILVNGVISSPVRVLPGVKIRVDVDVVVSLSLNVSSLPVE